MISTPLNQLPELARQIRYHCLTMTTWAGSGHPTSSLSAADLMTGLLFGGTFRYDLDHPGHPNNDRLIFSKGHASPLFYALWAATGRITEEELNTYRQFGSRLQGHPTSAFPYADAATGSLGQGLGIGLGMAINARRLDRLPYRTYVLLGDSEMSEGSQWESIQLAAYHKLNNLVGILDVNRLGQRGETMLGHDTAAHARRIEAFGWETIQIDGHDFPQILDAFARAYQSDRPVMIVARTVKGKGVSFLEDAEGWHGKTLDEKQLEDAVRELGPVDRKLTGAVPLPEDLRPAEHAISEPEPVAYEIGRMVATRAAYGNALRRLHAKHPHLVSLDGEVSNSTGAATFAKADPGGFFEMFIAEQNMVEVATGLALRGKHPCVSTFAAFFSRAFDQIRMNQYSHASITFVGSHAGVSVGEDGPSQMGLEDIAMFRAILHSTVLHPCDAVSAEKLTETALGRVGVVYLRTLRQTTPVIYGNDEVFPIGGCKILRQSEDDIATIVAAGATVHEALAAHASLHEAGISVRVIDAYSIKPIDGATLRAAAEATGALITVEDHYPAGGLGEAVLAAVAPVRPVIVSVLAIRQIPMSGTGEHLRDFFGISARAIIREVENLADPSRPVLWKDREAG